MAPQNAPKKFLVIANGPAEVPSSLERVLTDSPYAWHRAGVAEAVETLVGWVADDVPPVAVVLTDDVPDPLLVARQVHRTAPVTQIVFLAGTEREAELRRRMARLPMMERNWSIVDAHSQVLARELERAARSTSQRSSLRTTLDRMNQRIGTQPTSVNPSGPRHVLSDRHLASILEHAEDAIFAIDHEERVRIWNAGAARTFGYEEAAVVGRPITELVADAQQSALRGLLQRAWSGEAVLRYELTCRRAEGTTFDAEVTLGPVLGASEEVASVSAIARDVSDRKRREAEIGALNAQLEKRVAEASAANGKLKEALELLEEKQQALERANEALQQQATTDALTGLKNRLVFHDSLHEMIEVAARNGRRLSLLLIDIDHFKQVNDTWGHQGGDRALRQVAHALRRNVRSQDIVARFGGEEFAVLLPNTDLEAAVGVAETLRDGCRDAVDPGFGLTVSIGAAAYVRGDGNEALTRRADQALYAAKHHGRDQVRAASDLRPCPRPGS